jgi:hypothetical protein
MGLLPSYSTTIQVASLSSLRPQRSVQQTVGAVPMEVVFLLRIEEHRDY